MPAVLILHFSNTEGPDVNDIQVPYFVVDIPPSFDWNYTTVPQKALQNRTLSYPRGYVLGGSTSTSELSHYVCPIDPPGVDADRPSRLHVLHTRVIRRVR